MKVISLLICSLFLGSCVTIVNTPQLTKEIQTKGTETIVICDRFIMPTLPDLPKIPELSDNVINNRHLTEDALIHMLSEHRVAIKQTKKILNEAYKEYSLTCISK